MKNKILKSVILIIIIILMSTVLLKNTYAATTTRLMGDVSGDGKIDVEDVLNILRHISATNTGKNQEWILKDNNFKVANVIKETDKNKEEKVDVLDVLRILRYITAKNDKKIEENHKEWLELGEMKIETETNNNTQTSTNTQINTNINPQTNTIINNKTNIATNSKTNTTTNNKTNTVTKTIENKDNKNTNTATNVNTTNAITNNTINTKKTISIEVNNIKFEKKPKTVSLNRTVTVKATVLPANATNKTITYTSSNSKVASINSKTGIVKGKKTGTAKITAKSGNKSKSYTITVVNPVTKVTIKGLKTPFILEKGETLNLTATISPKGATNTTNANTAKAKFTSSKTKVATVTSAGKIKGIAKGTTTITVTAGEKKATCKVKVIESDFSFKNVPETLRVNDTLQLKKYISYTPKETTQKIKEWKSSDESVLSINSKTGKVKANKIGTAKITAILENGKKVTCKIIVKSSASSVKDKVIKVEGKKYKEVVTVNGKKYKIYDQRAFYNRVYDNVNWDLPESLLPVFGTIGCAPTAATVILQTYGFKGTPEDFAKELYSLKENRGSTPSASLSLKNTIDKLAKNGKIDTNVKTKLFYGVKDKDVTRKRFINALSQGHELLLDIECQNSFNDSYKYFGANHEIAVLAYDTKTNKVLVANTDKPGNVENPSGWFELDYVIDALGVSPSKGDANKNDGSVVEIYK